MFLWQVIADWGDFNKVQKVKSVLVLDFQKLNWLYEIYIDPNYTNVEIIYSLVISSQLCGKIFQLEHEGVFPSIFKSMYENGLPCLLSLLPGDSSSAIKLDRKLWKRDDPL